MRGGAGDFLIVGGGVAGLAAAYELNQSGGKITVVDAGYPPASAAAAGVLSPLPPWECGQRVAELIEYGRRRFFNFINEAQTVGGVDCEWRRAGMLSLMLPPPGAKAVAGATLVDAFSLAPKLAGARGRRGLWMPSVHQIRPAKLCAGLAAALQKQGVRFVRQPAKFELTGKTNSKIAALRLADGRRLSAGDYILCAGAAAAELCPPPKPPMTPVRGQILLYAPPKPLICIVLGEGGLYLSPRRDGRLLAGASFEENSGFDNRPSAAMAADLHRRAAALFPCLRREDLLNAWSGLRPCLPDGAPLIATHPAVENLHLNIGHGRYGICMAPGAASHLRRIMHSPQEENPFAWRDEWNAAA